MYVGDSAHPIARFTISSNFHCHVNGRCVRISLCRFIEFSELLLSDDILLGTATHLQLVVYQYFPLSPLVFAFISTCP
jgi:hypothetical protein